jgi:prepilin-type N-terminal cleavage/methylation domain-containing protein
MKTINCRDGFTLIEVLIAIILIGLGILSLISANGAFTQANEAGVEMSTAEFLIEQIRELSAVMPVIDPQSGITTFGPEASETLLTYDDLDDFNGASFSPPISVNRSTLNDLSAYTQQITVENVSASNFEQVVGNHTSPFVRVTVKVLYNTTEVNSAGWLRCQY